MVRKNNTYRYPDAGVSYDSVRPAMVKCRRGALPPLPTTVLEIANFLEGTSDVGGKRLVSSM